MMTKSCVHRLWWLNHFKTVKSQVRKRATIEFPPTLSRRLIYCPALKESGLKPAGRLT